MKNLLYFFVFAFSLIFVCVDLLQAFTEGSIPLWRRSSDVTLYEEPVSFVIEVLYRLVGLAFIFFYVYTSIIQPIMDKKGKIKRRNIHHNSRRKNKKRLKRWRQK